MEHVLLRTATPLLVTSVILLYATVLQVIMSLFTLDVVVPTHCARRRCAITILVFVLMRTFTLSTIALTPTVIQRLGWCHTLLGTALVRTGARKVTVIPKLTSVQPRRVRLMLLAVIATNACRQLVIPKLVNVHSSLLILLGLMYARTTLVILPLVIGPLWTNVTMASFAQLTSVIMRVSAGMSLVIAP